MTTMIELLLLLFLGVAWTWGVKCLFSDNMLLESIAVQARMKLPGYVTKPLFDCPPCMASIHGTLIYFALYGGNIWLWGLYCVMLCGLNYILKLNLFE